MAIDSMNTTVVGNRRLTMLISAGQGKELKRRSFPCDPILAGTARPDSHPYY
jgi:hypothetical protein